jgi:hypothetical protein
VVWSKHKEKRSLVGFTPGVNLTKVLHAAFWYKSFRAQLFCYYILGLYFLGGKIIGAKTALIMLVKLAQALSRDPFSVSAAL